MGNDTIPIFCKSYVQDLLRFERLLDSIEQHNKDSLAVVVSVPRDDIATFKRRIGINRCEILADDQILDSTPKCSAESFRGASGNLIQQVVKSEFWRIADCEAYLCIDSDSAFIRDFYLTDFIASDGTPYSVLHQCKEYLQMASNLMESRVVEDFLQDSNRFKAFFSRSGPDYDFGPTPVIWSRKVWEELHSKVFEPRGWSMLDAIKLMPAELRWYGEALLRYRPIPLHPIEPLFRVYHSEWQFNALENQGEESIKVSRNFLGIVFQSNWDKSLDFGVKPKSLLSKTAKEIRTFLRSFKR